MGVEYFPQIRLRVWPCRHQGCDRVVSMGMYYCKEHLKPELKQSEPVDPKLAARNRMVMAGECYVYAVEGAEQVKFGKAMDVVARFGSLQTGSPIDLVLLGFVLGPKTLEKQIHQWAAPFRRRGEWFNKSPAVMRLVEAIQTGAVDKVFALLKINVDSESN
jgi:hypothetical protein